MSYIIRESGEFGQDSNSYERINEVFEQISKINEIMSQLQNNTNSNEKNLNLFFEDAKMLFTNYVVGTEETSADTIISNLGQSISI